jgi:hypothetical protein
VPDCTLHVTDTSLVSPVQVASQNVPTIISNIVSANKYLNSKEPARAYIFKERNPVQQNDIFYALLVLVFLMAICKRFFPRYFSNMFRVFFNSSLRQSQLTDQLIQEKVPSLFFNCLFITAVAFYISILFSMYYLEIRYFNCHIFLIVCIALVIIYIIKFLSLKFIGWISGYRQEADIYIFIIFLINKIIGICLLPIIVAMTFTDITFSNVAVLLSFILIGLMLLMRFFRSYGLLQHRLNVNPFHFLLYIIAMELLPIALIYKAGVMFVTKIL